MFSETIFSMTARRSNRARVEGLEVEGDSAASAFHKRTVCRVAFVAQHRRVVGKARTT